ncbi:MAG: hypothetical protein HQ559_07665 [Lentisphaerae bacterium]|nr:hypothetical protein [Lentisphaerota bacterium]
MLVTGSPAVVRGPNTVGLKRNGVDADSRALLKRVYRTLFREGKAMAVAIREVLETGETCPEVDVLISFLEGSERGVTGGPGAQTEARNDHE